MAETLLFSITEQILWKLASGAFQQIGSAVGVNQDLKKLEETLFTIKAVLLDAEEKQATNRPLSLWLERLKDACHDADDVLDEFAYETLRQQVVAHRESLKTKVRNFFPHLGLKFRLAMGNKINNIRERLDEIAANRTQFQLTVRDVDWHVEKEEREMTHSFIRSSDVIGRDIDQNEIVKLLICQNIQQNFSVVPIVGIGGLGKTTLAKLVYNDERVEECFKLKMWICVSDDFSLKRLTKDIVEAATRDNCSDMSIDQLQTRLRDTLQCKKFLLVLDDVWNDDLEKWNELRELLLDGATGSKVIATTRSHSVASIMGTVPPYILEGLSDSHCWSLFVKCAFKEGQERQYPKLERIGKEIIKKCSGVPLAVRSLGSMLFLKIDERDWLSVKESEIWKLEQRENDILPALKLSYKRLPSHLKQCFAYCSIFPKDYMFVNINLIEMWIAQGYIKSSNENEELEDIGNRYIKELLSRCFFQDMQEHGCVVYFKMHDLVHDLALLVAQGECCVINDTSTHGISNRTRHVSFSNRNLSAKEIPSVLLDLSYLRTILFPNDVVEGTSKLFAETCITRLKCLRMLDLRNSSFEVLPKSIGSLSHLRFLDMSGSRTMKKLPNSICKLLHLQTLRLVGCWELEELPRDIEHLISLRTLCVAAKKIYLLPDKGIGCLASLRHLLIQGCPNLITSGEGMERLTALRKFVLSSCNNVETLPGMKHLPALETLIIWDCEKLNVMEWEDNIHDLSLTTLRFIVFDGLPKLYALPEWLQGASNSLQHLSVHNCSCLKSLPHWLPNFTSLQKIGIENCPHISALPEEMCLLTSLRELEITDCLQLSDRCERAMCGDWHKISHIPVKKFNGRTITSSSDAIEIAYYT